MTRVFCLLALLSLGGCAFLTTAIPIAAGVFTIGKDVFDVDVSLHQQTPTKTPLMEMLP
jgi:hypothetical protein